MTQENGKLKASASIPGGGVGGGPLTGEHEDTVKRLKKRELECQALWDTIKDMKIQGQNIFDVSQVLAILKKRALDTKANRKLDLGF